MCIRHFLFLSHLKVSHFSYCLFISLSMNLPTRALQPDILEFFLANKASLNSLRREWRSLEKGFVGYFKDFRDTIRDLRGSGEVKEEDSHVGKSPASRVMNQFYESEELAKKMKWKGITWDEGADYEAFSRRLLDNDDLMKNVSAFSFLSIHVTKDTFYTGAACFPPRERKIETGSLTNWFLRERNPLPVEKYVPSTVGCMRGPFEVDWTSGVARVVDTTSIQEVLVFLQTVAPRLQALQVRMEEQQSKIAKDVQNLKLRVGVTVKYNKYNTTLWDDPSRGTDSNYVTPDDVQCFVDGMLKSALLYRWFLKDQCVRIVPPGCPYLFNLEEKEIQIPSNFASYNWWGAHARFEKVELLISCMINIWWLWFLLAIVIVGDVEIL
uniref:Uncharacterized protein n=1 Tax=Trypanosoma congolense (strain IL3000) TaxID=1068625 RepID=G0UUJ7_TRYCI|nr:conserved hypothetical protein [Trypanosoma congolense IL3000]